MTTTSLSEYVYYVSFINEFSRKTWIYFLKGKNEVFSKFKEFKALVENLSEKKIKILRSDMEESSHRVNSRHFAVKLGLRGSALLPTILNRMA